MAQLELYSANLGRCSFFGSYLQLGLVMVEEDKTGMHLFSLSNSTLIYLYWKKAHSLVNKILTKWVVLVHGRQQEGFKNTVRRVLMLHIALNV